MITAEHGLLINLGDQLDPIFKFDSIKLTSMYGAMPPDGLLTGKIDRSSVDLNTISEIPINITQENGVNLDFTGYVYRITSEGMNVSFRFHPFHPDSVTKPSSSSYSNVTEGVRDNLLNLKLDSNCESDVTNSLKLYKSNETNFDYLKKLLQSYKRNSIFAFDWGKVIIRDLEKKSTDFNWMLLDERQVEFKRSKFWDMSTQVCYEGSSMRSIIYNKSIYVYNKDYQHLNENFLNNDKFYTVSSSEFQDSIKVIPEFNLCDYVKVYSDHYDFKDMILTGKIITITLNSLNCDLKFKSMTI